MPDSIQGSTERIAAWFAANAPDAKFAWAGPADEARLADLQRQIGRELPPEFLTLYRLHDGQQPRGPGLIPDMVNAHGFAGDPHELASVEQIAADWASWKSLLDIGEFEGREPPEAEPGVRAAAWREGWIPIANNGGGDHFCIDLDPAPGGVAGQIILVSHEGNPRRRLAESLTALLEWLADQLESGGVVVRAEPGETPLVYASNAR